MVSQKYTADDTLRSRRATSVPSNALRSFLVEESSLGKAYLISSHALHDADAMTAASRRHDRDFLHDISNKLAGVKAPGKYVQEAVPIHIGALYSGSLYRAIPTALPREDFRRKTWMSPPVTDYEVNAYLTSGPSRTYKRHSRGISMPPLRASYPSVPKWYPSTSSPTTSSITRVRPIYNREDLATHDDVVVGVAHTSLYGDIVIGIPYSKRHMFNLEPQVASTPVKSTYRRASVAVPYRNMYEGHDDFATGSPHFNNRSTAQRYHIEDEGTPTYKPKRSAASYRCRAASVATKLEGIPEFQLYTSRNQPVLTSALAACRATSVPPITTSYANLSLSGGNAAKPPTMKKKVALSEARRKVRDLLCKTKNDPHYFDD